MGHWHWRRSGLHLSLVPSHTDFPGDSNHLGHLMRESSRHQQWCRFLASGRLETVPLAEAVFDPERVAQVRTANARLRVPGLQAHAQACATGAFVSPMHLFSTGGSNVHHCPFCNYEIGNKSHLWWYCRVTNPTRRRCGGALCGVYNARTVRPMSVGEFMNGCLTSLWIKVRRPRRHGGRRVGTGLNICSWNPECSHGGRNSRNISELAWDQRVALAHACLQGAYLFIVEMVPRHAAWWSMCRSCHKQLSALDCALCREAPCGVCNLGASITELNFGLWVVTFPSCSWFGFASPACASDHALHASKFLLWAWAP